MFFVCFARQLSADLQGGFFIFFSSFFVFLVLSCVGTKTAVLTCKVDFSLFYLYVLVLTCKVAFSTFLVLSCLGTNIAVLTCKVTFSFCVGTNTWALSYVFAVCVCWRSFLLCVFYDFHS